MPIRFVAAELHFDLTKEFKVEREMSSAEMGIREKQLECVKFNVLVPKFMTICGLLSQLLDSSLRSGVEERNQTGEPQSWFS